MKKYVYICFVLLLIPNIFGDVYKDIRADLSTLANKTTVATVARELKVNSNTLRSFLNQQSQTSPKVKKAYEAWRLKTTPIKVDIVVTPLALVIKTEAAEATVVTPPPTALKVARRLDFSSSRLEPAPIHIPIRGSLDDKDAKGIWFDHYVFQRATQHLSKAVVPDGVTYPSPALSTYIRQNPYALPYDIEHCSQVPPLQATEDDAGLLIIPGRMRDREYDSTRATHENALIRRALLRGQPILCICAGSWRVWDILRQIDHDPTFTRIVTEGLVEVTDHSASRMMSFSENTGQIVYNIELHGVKVESDSLLHSIMGKSAPTELNVNSVHWKSPSKTKIPNNVRITAIATKGDVKETHNRHGNIIQLETGTVEAFETILGAPIIGIQWHPEAYNPKDADSKWHLNILRWMAKAGDAYAQKRRVLKELIQTLKIKN